MNFRPANHGQTFGSRPELSDQDFRRIAALARAEFGIQIEPQKKSMVQSRLTKRLRNLGMRNFSEYCDLVEGRDRAEREKFISAITTNVTHFYREVHHFKQLQSEILPQLAPKVKAGGRLRIWSAGCSSGPEPYSIGGSVIKVIPDAARLDVQIHATDLDRDVLAKAEKASYPTDECQVPGPEWGAQVFDRLGKNASEQKVRSEVADLVKFRQLNLNSQWQGVGKYDCIFCRNVAIYFDREVQQKLWSRFVGALTAGGTLFIGHSERLSGPAKDQLTPCGITAYRRKA